MRFAPVGTVRLFVIDRFRLSGKIPPLDELPVGRDVVDFAGR